MPFLDKLKQRVSEVRTAALDAIEANYADDAVKNARLSVCQGCEHLFKPTGNCKKCGCFVEVKISLEHSRCPIGRW